MDEFERLARGLEDPDEHRAFEAAVALGDLGDQRAVPVLIRLLRTTGSNRIRNGAAIGLRELADPAALHPLLEQIRRLENAGDTGTLIYALETLDARVALVDLARFLCEGGYEAAWASAGVLDGLEGPLDPDRKREVMGILERCLARGGHEEWRVEMLSGGLRLLEDYEGDPC